jgi:nicotinamide mononucleotide transporter
MELFIVFLLPQWLNISLIWIKNNYIEILATISGLIYLYYSIKSDKKLWIYGLITSSLYVYVCFIAGIYADMGINFYYVIVSVYGWIHWTYYGDKNAKVIPITKTKQKEFIVLWGVTSLLYAIIAYILIRFTDSTIPYWDAFTTSASITATWMLARKMIEHWIIWVVVDAISIGLYIYKELYPTTILFFVYTILAITGYFEWKKQWLTQNEKL